MRVVLQRVTRADVKIEGQTVATIGGGLLLFVGIGKGDKEEDADRMAAKIAKLRIFGDENGKTRANRMLAALSSRSTRTVRVETALVSKGRSSPRALACSWIDWWRRSPLVVLWSGPVSSGRTCPFR